MKKLLVLILISLLVLCSCDSGAGGVSDDTGEFSSAGDEVSQNGGEENNLPVGKDELLAKAKKLVEDDITLMGIFAGGALSNGDEGKDYTPAQGKYEDYETLLSLAQSVYADEQIAERMLSYPDYGEDAVINSDGKTEYKYSYINDFAATARQADVSIISFDDTSASISVKISGKTFSLGMAKVNGKWKLANSVYFAYLQSEIDVQKASGWENSIYLSTRQNVGSAPRLAGKFLVLNVFLNDSFTSWKDSDRKNVEDNIDRACEWLVTKSRGYSSANLAIDTQSLFYVHSDSVPADYEMAFLDIMFRNTVYVDVNGYIEKNTPAGYDGVCVLFHVWKNGSDYCIPCDKENTDYLTYYGERAMFYYSKNAGHQPSSYVYMLLQLCGGELLYGRKDTEQLAELFPGEIMLSKKFLSLPLQDYSVSPLTAFLLGWTDYIDTQLIQFTDTQRGIK